MLRVVQWRLAEGEPSHVGDRTVTPRSRVLVVQVPRAGLVWQTPASVRVERDGRIEELRILDVGRLAQVALGAMVLMTASMMAWQARRS